MVELTPVILDPKRLILAGSVFYGDPFHSAKEWTYENEIGLLWTRFMRLAQKYEFLLGDIAINPGKSYEVHIETTEYQKTRNYYVFVGIEVENDQDLPLEMFIKPLPETKYAVITTTGDDPERGRWFFNQWLPHSGFVQSYPYIIQGYEEGRYFGLNNPRSEIDWYIPIRETPPQEVDT